MTSQQMIKYRKLLRIVKAQLGLITLSKGELSERRKGESKAECVERKIPVLIDEGMEQNQAVAVANSICEL